MRKKKAIEEIAVLKSAAVRRFANRNFLTSPGILGTSNVSDSESLETCETSLFCY
jgi:hypothetical protein